MNKKIKLIIFVLLGIVILFISTKLLGPKKEEKNKGEVLNNNFNEYTPLEEITEEQNRQTTINLYFKNKETGKLVKEEKRIDSKNLLKEPYKYLIECLIQGSENQEVITCIPKGTKVVSAVLKRDTVELNLSKEFIENHEGTLEAEQQTIDCIVKTLTELNEVEYVKILIDGEENLEFKDKQINFKEKFSIKQ